MNTSCVPFYWRRWFQTSFHSRPFFLRHALILSLLRMSNATDAIEAVVENFVCSSNTSLTCTDFLNVSCRTGTFCTSFTDIFTDSTNLSYEISNTTQSQPSVKIVVENGDYKTLRGKGRVDAYSRGYTIGYRECVSNPAEVCHIFHNNLPEPEPDNWTHDITVNPSSSRPLPLGERCTFFGCFVYCNLVSCQRVFRNFLEENITIVATCPDLGNTTENGNVNYTRDPTEQGRYVESTTVTVTCDEGYRGGGVIACQNDGNWSSSSLPNCTSVDCGTPPVLLNGDTLHEPFNTTYNSLVTYRCNSPYVFSNTSSENHTCLLSGQWSSETIECLATCPDLGNTTENGNVSYTRDPTEQGHYVENTAITISCDEGYRCSGDITCQNDGNWSSSSLPNCTSVDCGTPPVLLNGHTLHEPFDTTYNSLVTYRCNSPYVFSNTSSENHTCLLSGQWSSETIACLATCPDLGNTTENGNVSYTRDPTELGRYVENTTVIVSCDDGYKGGGVITCQNDGNWSSSSLPNCTSQLPEHQKLIIFILSSSILGLLGFIAILYSLCKYCRSNGNNKVRLYNGLQTRNEKLDTSFTPVDVRPYHLPSFVNESDCEQDYELAKSTSVETDTSILPQLERLAQL